MILTDNNILDILYFYYIFN